MKITTIDPQRAVVTAAIDFHTAIKAVQELAAKYPIERVSMDHTNGILRAYNVLAQRLRDREISLDTLRKL
jgi:hypothetical protein